MRSRMADVALQGERNVARLYPWAECLAAIGGDNPDGRNTLGLLAVSFGRLEGGRTCAVKVPILIVSFKVPTTHPRRSFSGNPKPAGGGPSRCRSLTPS
jgi:hypothetical protein